MDRTERKSEAAKGFRGVMKERTSRTFQIFDFENKKSISIYATKSGHEWKSLCPFHDDKIPSLSINPDKDGGVFNCFGCGRKGSLYDASKDPANKESNPQKTIIATYDYTDENGNLLFQTVRYSPKDFRQRRPNGNGDWIWDLKGIQTIPYRLPDILKSEEVVIVEGEKDSDNLALLGFTATTSPMGAGKWRDHYNEALRGKSVILIPDNDDQGLSHMRQVAISLNGIVASLKWIKLPGLTPGGDFSDWASMFKNPEEIKESLAIMIEGAEPYAPPPSPEPEQDPKQPIKFSEVSFTPREHIVKNFPLDRKLLYVHSAEGGGLKSFIGLHLIKCILAGRPLFGRYEILLRGSVLLFDEETPEPIMEERFNGFGLKNKDFEGYLFHFSGLKVDKIDDLKQILSMVEKYHPVLCVFDSLTRFHDAEENSNTEMKKVMMNFRKVTEMGPMGWLIHHVAKDSKFSRGATEIVNAADLEFRSSVDKEGFLTLKAGKVRIETPEPIVLKAVFDSGNFDVVYQMSQGIQLWEQIRATLDAVGEPMTIDDIARELESQGIMDVRSKKIRDTLDGKVKSNLVVKEKITIQTEDKTGRIRSREVAHYGLA